MTTIIAQFEKYQSDPTSQRLSVESQASIEKILSLLRQLKSNVEEGATDKSELTEIYNKLKELKGTSPDLMQDDFLEFLKCILQYPIYFCFDYGKLY